MNWIGEMKSTSLIFIAAVYAAGMNSAGAQTAAQDATIRAGRNIVVTDCIACHVVPGGQAPKPVLGTNVPSFQEIANRPDATVESLRAAMKMARWHDPTMTAALLPMSRITDEERSQAAAYIMSLRANH